TSHGGPNVNVSLAPGKSSTFHLPATVPLNLAPGAYYATATITSLSNAIVDSNPNNDLGVTPTILTVLSPFPNIATTYNGAFAITKGPNKGTKGTIQLTVATEDNTTGDITGTGHNSLGENFTFGGTITPAGAVTFNANDSTNNI